MNIAIILSGGKGIRFQSNIPKQYIKVEDKPIIQFCLETFQKSPSIDKIIIVLDLSWQNYVAEIIKKVGISKFCNFAVAGSSRQHSILKGLKSARQIVTPNSNVIIHDAVRPNVTIETIETCIKKLQEAEGVMPVLPLKDTIYISKDGMEITSLLDRRQLFAGQSPEGFHLEPYLSLHENLSEQELSLVNGSSELAYRHGLHVAFIKGDENNYKITTKVDFDKFCDEMRNKK